MNRSIEDLEREVDELREFNRSLRIDSEILAEDSSRWTKRFVWLGIALLISIAANVALSMTALVRNASHNPELSKEIDDLCRARQEQKQEQEDP